MLPASRARALSGEIEYAFDTALNKTQARLETSLASRNILSRMFSGSPVHTLASIYEFGGHAATITPDSIRLSLSSAEYTQASPGYRPSPAAEPVLIITSEDSVVRFPLDIAQRTEVWSAPDFVSGTTRLPSGENLVTNSHESASQIYTRRTATVRLSTCDFLALINGKNVRGTVAGLDFDLSEEVISRLRQFATEMAPSAAPRGGFGCRSR